MGYISLAAHFEISNMEQVFTKYWITVLWTSNWYAICQIKHPLIKSLKRWILIQLTVILDKRWCFQRQWTTLGAWFSEDVLTNSSWISWPLKRIPKQTSNNLKHNYLLTFFLPKLWGKQMMNSHVSTNIYKHLCYFHRSYVTEKRYTAILCFVRDTF